MHFSFAVLSVLATVASTYAQLPNCATQCLTSAKVPDGCSGPLDTKCLCASPQFITDTTSCIEKACTGSDLTAAETAAQQLCQQAGVTLSSTPVPSSTAPSSSGSAAGSQSSGSSTGSSTGLSTGSSTGSSAGSSTSSAASTTKTSPPATTSNAASSFGVNTFAGVAAVGLAALAL